MGDIGGMGEKSQLPLLRRSRQVQAAAVGLPVPKPGVDREAGRCAAGRDSVHAEVLAGWVWDPYVPDLPAYLEIDGIACLRTTSLQHRRPRARRKPDHCAEPAAQNARSLRVRPAAGDFGPAAENPRRWWRVRDL